MARIAEARATVQRARLRLIAAAVARRGVDGLLWGSVVGSTLAVVLVLARGAAPAWLAALPLAGGLLGAARSLLRPPREADAALALDREAGTEEAFLSAVSAADAPEAFRELAAGYALERCPARRVGTLLPLTAPAGASRAVVAYALLVALVVVPAASANGAPPVAPVRPPVQAATGAGTSAGRPPASPEERARALLAALEQVREAEAERLAPAVRRTLPELGADELADLARQLADGADGPSAEAARKALEALANGRLDEAARALHEALGGSIGTSAGAPDGAGTEGAGTGARSRTPGPWSASRWPLRYDRQVQRWLELAPHADDSEPGGNR